MHHQNAKRRVQDLYHQAQAAEYLGNSAKAKMLLAEISDLERLEEERQQKLGMAATRLAAIKRRLDAIWMLFPKAMTLEALAQACPEARPLVAELEHLQESIERLEHEAA